MFCPFCWILMMYIFVLWLQSPCLVFFLLNQQWDRRVWTSSHCVPAWNLILNPVLALSLTSEKNVSLASGMEFPRRDLALLFLYLEELFVPSNGSGVTEQGWKQRLPVCSASCSKGGEGPSLVPGLLLPRSSSMFLWLFQALPDSNPLD